MSDPRPVASLSLDLDNQWSYMKTHGDAGWETLPTYLPTVIPRALDLLAREGLRITFFVVGQDAARPENGEALRSLADAGHEIGNHSFSHEPWLHLYAEAQIEDELARTEEEMERVTGVLPIGFRGPGYSFSETLLRLLVKRGYRYDASTFPTFLGPLARAYYFMQSRLSRGEKEQRKRLFGTLGEGLRPLRPYHWRLSDAGEILEIPVTTMPIVRTPFHFSYLLYLRRLGRALPMLYFRLALLLCRLRGVAPSLLLHPLDLLGRDDETGLDFFPAMDLPAEVKVDLVRQVVRRLTSRYRVLPMREHADHIERQAELPRVDLPAAGAEPVHLP